MENYFTPDNWNVRQYRHNEQFAIISLVADPGILDSSFTYCVTMLDDDHNELAQTSFQNIDDACRYINEQYKELWDFKDLRLKKSDGCSSCVAH